MVAIPFVGTTNTAGAGVATVTVESAGVVRGLVHAFVVDKHASAPVTTDVTLRTKGTTLPSYNVIALADSAADATTFPARGVTSESNAAITNSHRPVPVCDVLEMVVAQANNSQEFRGWALVEVMTD